MFDEGTDPCGLLHCWLSPAGASKTRYLNIRILTFFTITVLAIAVAHTLAQALRLSASCEPSGLSRRIVRGNHGTHARPRAPKWAACRGGDLVSWHQVSVQYLPRRDSSVAASHFLLSGASLVPRRRKRISNQAGRVAGRLEATGNGSLQRAEEAEHAESPATQPDAVLVYGYMNGDLIAYDFRLLEAKLLVLGTG